MHPRMPARILRSLVLAAALLPLTALAGELDVPLAAGYGPLNAVTPHGPASALESLAGDERVLVIYGQRHFRAKPFNATAAALSDVDTVQAAPYGLTGNGIVVSSFEFAPIDVTHPEFGGRATVDFTCGTSDSDCTNLDNKEHVTHTAGTMIAAGNNPAAKGMAPKATIHEFRADKGAWLTLKQTGLKNVNSVADNNSWGFTLGWCDSCGASTGWEWITGSEDLIGGYSGDLNAVLDHVAFLSGNLGIYASGNEGSVLGPTVAPFQHNHVDQSDPKFGPTTAVYCVSKNGSGTDCSTPCKTGNDPWG